MFKKTRVKGAPKPLGPRKHIDKAYDKAHDKVKKLSVVSRPWETGTVKFYV